jgi:hypothetical protein
MPLGACASPPPPLPSPPTPMSPHLLHRQHARLELHRELLALPRPQVRRARALLQPPRLRGGGGGARTHGTVGGRMAIRGTMPSLPPVAWSPARAHPPHASSPHARPSCAARPHGPHSHAAPCAPALTAGVAPWYAQFLPPSRGTDPARTPRTHGRQTQPARTVAPRPSPHVHDHAVVGELERPAELRHRLRKEGPGGQAGGGRWRAGGHACSRVRCYRRSLPSALRLYTPA